MTTTDTQFQGSIPGIYDEYLGPLLFEPYAEDLAARLRGFDKGVLLETAAGTGIVTRALAQVLSPDVRLVATDLNEAMLEVAARHVTATSVSWKQADAQRLPFGDAEFGVVVCQFGIMFMPDKAAAFREARRVLAPAGRFVFNVWDRLEANEVSHVVNQAVAKVFPHDPPRFFERTPFGYCDPLVIRGELEKAGFQQVAIESVEKASSVSTPDAPATGLCKGTPLRAEIEARGPGRLDEITAVASEALAARFGRSFENRMRALVVMAS